MTHATIAIELMMLAIAVAIFVKFIRLPYTTALVTCGFVIGLTHILKIPIERDLLLLAFIPPLLFEGALNMDLELLKEQWLPVALLALAGTVLGAMTLGGILWIGTGWALGSPVPFITCLFLGTILSATDPVSVLAMFKEFGVEKRLATLLEGESVFNDGIAVVLYMILYEVLLSGGELPSPGEGLTRMVLVAGGGIAVGLAIGWVVYRILQRIDDHLLEVMISVVLAWGSYLLAEKFHASGVLATASAGLIIGNYGRLFSMSATTRVTLNAFWEVAAFIANSFVFILIGLQLDRADFSQHLPVIFITIVGLIVSRALVVYGLCPLMRLFGWGIPMSWQHVLNVGGLRGSIPIALALGLPEGMEHRGLIVTAVFGAVFFSLVVNGLLVKPTLRRLGLIGADAVQYEFELKLVRAIALKAALKEAKKTAEDGHVPASICEKLIQELERERETINREIGMLQERHDLLGHGQERRVRRRLLLSQRSAVEDAFRRGVISEQALEHERLRIDGLYTDLIGE